MAIVLESMLIEWQKKLRIRLGTSLDPDKPINLFSAGGDGGSTVYSKRIADRGHQASALRGN